MPAQVADQVMKGGLETVVKPTGPGDRGDWVLFHPVYTPSELKAVEVLHRTPDNMRDRAASILVKALRYVPHAHSFNPRD